MNRVHQLTRTQARRIAVHAQLLTADRPDNLFEVLHRIEMLQLEPTNAIAPSADLVMWSRLGSAYDRTELTDAADRQQLIQFRGMLRPAEDMALYRPDMAAARSDWVDINHGFRADILERLRMDGPLPLSELPDTCVEPWASTGWTNNRNVAKMLDLLSQLGQVAIAGGTGRDRLWDLAERIYPTDRMVPIDDARRARTERRLQALGIARPDGEAGEDATVDGVRGKWRVDPTYLEVPFKGRAALLSPFDRLITDRKRMLELFEFDYNLEMYKSESNRRWGFYALPILYGDKLVGKLDAKAMREEKTLQINKIHRDGDWSKAMEKAIEREISDLANWLSLRLVFADR